MVFLVEKKLCPIFKKLSKHHLILELISYLWSICIDSNVYIICMKVGIFFKLYTHLEKLLTCHSDFVKKFSLTKKLSFPPRYLIGINIIYTIIFVWTNNLDLILELYHNKFNWIKFRKTYDATSGSPSKTSFNL